MSGGRLGALVALLVLLVGGTARAEDDSWRVELDRQAERDLRGWAVAGAVVGAVELGTLVATSFRAPGSVELLISNLPLSAPVGAGLASTGVARHLLRTTPDLESFRRRSLCAGLVFSLTGATLTTIFGLGLAVFTYLTPPPLAVALGVLPFAVATPGFVAFAWAQRAARLLGEPPREARRPPPQLVAAGPTGVVVLF